jgi:putative endonuclease
MNGYVYILQSLRNQRFYIGSTNDLERRFLEHNSGKKKYTRINKPFNLVFSQDFGDLTIARKIEYKLKQLKSRRVILDIIKSGKIEVDKKLNLSW